MEYQAFDLTTLSTLRNELSELLTKYGMVANLNIEVGNIKFSATEAALGIKVNVKGVQTPGALMVATQAKILGLVMENTAGDRLVSYESKNFKFPFIYERKDGKQFKCTASQAAVLFRA